MERFNSKMLNEAEIKEVSGQNLKYDSSFGKYG